MAALNCRGRGSATPSFLPLFLAFCFCCGIASATVWTVGDTRGWITGFDYSTWTTGKSFAMGDTLFFPYTKGLHDVAVVSESDYDSCSSSNAMATYIDGNTNVTLNSTGSHYYICTISGHCADQMKVTVDVSGNASSSTPASNSTSNGTSAGVPTVVPFQMGSFAAISSVVLTGFLL